MLDNLYPNDENYPYPSFQRPIPSPDVDPDAGDLVSASFNADWIPAMEGALDQLMLPSTWEGTSDDKTLALQRAANLKDIIAAASVRVVDTPYWDDSTDVDDEADVDMQTWYGEVDDPAVPPDALTFRENAEIWTFAGLLAIAATPGAALAFLTIAPKFVLAFKQGNIGKVIRAFVDAAQVGEVTDDGSGDIVEISVLGDPDLDEHQIYVTVGDA